MNKWLKIVAFIIICQMAGLIGSIFTFPSIPTWYASLNKPSFSPPNWLFGPVWITLYTLMGISAYIIWEKGIKKKEIKVAIGLFSAQLILNSIWSFLFFGLQNPLFAFVEICILWIFILATIISFFRIDRKAAYLMVPYILWVSFALILNYSIYLLN